jgi:hypothetical protein
VLESIPERVAEEQYGEVGDLVRLHERQGFEDLVERAEAARKHEEGARVLHEHQLANEKVPGRVGAIDEGILRLLVGQADVQPDREAAAFATAAVRRLHHARAAARQDVEPHACDRRRDRARQSIFGR